MARLLGHKREVARLLRYKRSGEISGTLERSGENIREKWGDFRE